MGCYATARQKTLRRPTDDPQAVKGFNARLQAASSSSDALRWNLRDSSGT
jgi:hypothetical protein